jgi:hypothetical protein
MSIRRNVNLSHDKIPLFGLSSSEVGLHDIQQQSWFIWILFMKSVNCFTLGMKFGGFPIGHIITDPFNQILEFAAMYPGVQD